MLNLLWVDMYWGMWECVNVLKDLSDLSDCSDLWDFGVLTCCAIIKKPCSFWGQGLSSLRRFLRLGDEVGA